MLDNTGRSGPTRVEVAVMVIVALVLFGLMMPGFQSQPRAPALHCKNNMKQLALAAIAHEASGAGGFPRLQNPRNNRVVSWQVMLLPNLGRSDIFDQYESDSEVPSRPPISLFVCPSDKSISSDLPANSYVINGGMATLDVKLENLADGISFTEFGLRADQIIDGASNTLLFAENIQATTWDAAPTIPAPIDWDGRSSKLASTFLWQMTGNPTAEMRINGPQGKRLDKIPLRLTSARPSSHHHGFVNVAFCDGRADQIREDIDYRVFIQLMTSDHANSSLQQAEDVPPELKTYVLQDTDY